MGSHAGQEHWSQLGSPFAGPEISAGRCPRWICFPPLWTGPAGLPCAPHPPALKSHWDYWEVTNPERVWTFLLSEGCRVSLSWRFSEAVTLVVRRVPETTAWANGSLGGLRGLSIWSSLWLWFIIVKGCKAKPAKEKACGAKYRGNQAKASKGLFPQRPPGCD